MMSQIHVEVSETIAASPEKIYGVLADYRQGHPAILPKPYFTELVVEAGGVGAGTVIRVRMNVMGIEQAYHMTVTEPEPGRVLAEDDPAVGVHTTFTVEPLNGGQQSQVTIATVSKASPGFKGLLERLMNPPVARCIYRQELRNLADYVRSLQ